MDLQKVKAVLFDLDGTLLDTVRDIGACVNDIMRRYGYPEGTYEEVCSRVGHGARNLIVDSTPAGTPDEIIDKMWEEYVLHYRENCTTFTAYYPGVREFLKDLDAKKYKIGVITNKTQKTAERVINHYFPDVYFDLLWGNNGVRPLKPSIESAKLACETLELEPDEILFVGDGDTDMEFASRAGFIACGVTWGYRPKETLLQCGADFLVGFFDDLRERLYV